jgi:hypothetical protein
LSVAVTSLSLHKNDTWPNFSFPHNAERLNKPHELSKAVLIALSPVVNADERSAWEDYAFSTQDEWANEGLVTQGEERRLNQIPYSIHSGTSGGYIPVDVTGPFSPLWQIDPVPSDKSIVNFDLFENEFVKKLAHHVDTTKNAALSRVINMTQLFGTSFGHLGETPESLLLQPIFENFDEDAKIVAHFAAVLEWDLYFKNILHEGADGIILVVKDTCNEVFTFEINGPEVTFLGDGDFHDKQYDHMVRTTRFDDFNQDENENEIEDGESCKFFLHVYPSDLTHGNYETNSAALSTMAVVLIFFLTALVFVIYDRMVQLRQDKVMNTANRTNEIVASLFPENVRDQIFAEEDAGDSKNKNKAFSGKQGLKNFLEEEGHGEDNVIAYDSKPIADLFPYTTIMFADISGFTSWSSVREPCQVFTLLESIYHAFDQIARQRGVFKVETVGDCYVAVSGLPEPNKVCKCGTRKTTDLIRILTHCHSSLEILRLHRTMQW